MTEADLEAVRRVDLGAASALEHYRLWDERCAERLGDTAADRLRTFYGRRWVELAATHPDLRHLVDDADLQEFGDALETPKALARAAHLEAAEHLRETERRHQDGAMGLVALCCARAEKEITFCVWKREEAQERARRCEATTSQQEGDRWRAGVERRAHLETVDWMQGEIARLTDWALQHGVPAEEVARMTRGRPPWPAR